CTPGRGNEKGKIERQIQYLRHAFFAARTFRDVDDLNAQFRRWRDEIAHQRRHPEHPDQTVAQIFAQEQPRLLPLPAHPFDTAVKRIVTSGKTPYVCFDRNSYSIPHTHRQQPLTLIASPTTVRLIAGAAEEIAEHPRSYDTGQTIEQEDHVAGLVPATRPPNPSTPPPPLGRAGDRNTVGPAGGARRIPARPPRPFAGAARRLRPAGPRRRGGPGPRARRTRRRRHSPYFGNPPAPAGTEAAHALGVTRSARGPGSRSDAASVGVLR